MELKIPIGHQVVMPYLLVKGAAEFIAFTAKVFDAQLTFSKMREDETTVMHAEIQISGSTIMFCDATDQFKEQTGNLFVYVLDADHTYALALEAGATTVMPPEDQNYGRSCGITDTVGNVWWITSV